MVSGLAVVAVTACLAFPGAASATESNKTEHFSLINTSTNQASLMYSAIATGDFTAGGTATMSGPVLTLQFPSGTITLNVKNSHSHKSESPTCVQVKTSSGSYAISKGTGIYKGISGSGNSTVSVTLVENPVDGSCPETPDAAQAVIAASGPVSLT